MCRIFLLNLVLLLRNEILLLEKMIIRLEMKRENVPPSKYLCFLVLTLQLWCPKCKPSVKSA